MPYLKGLRRRISLATASLVIALCLVTAFAGIVLAFLLMRRTNRLFADTMLPHYFAYWQDLPAAVPVLGTLIALAIIPGRKGGRPLTINIGLLAPGVLILCWIGTHMVFGDYPLSFDEYMANFDAEIFRHGQLVAPLPAQWRAFTHALQPEFLLAPGKLAWSSAYLPVGAGVRSLFALIGNASLTGPTLAAASIVLVHAIARKLLPEDREYDGVATLLLASSAQFLITAMTPYAMTAHLTFNLLWLWLVLHDRRWALVFAVIVSFLATGLHQLVFHPMFVAPFVPWLWLNGRRWPAVILAGGLLVSGLFWASWGGLLSQAIGAPPAPATDPLSLVDKAEALARHAWRPVSLAFMADNLLRLITWQNPLMWVLALAPFLAPKRQPSIIWPLVAGAFGTLALMMLVLPYQGHGWGYRYLHGFLGSFALLAAFGWRTIVTRRAEQAPRLRTWTAVSMAAALVLLLPLHAAQAYRFTLPYRQANEAIARIDADVVIIEDRGRWYAQDLVRNDPYLRNRPLRLMARRLPWSEVERLCAERRVMVVDRTSPQVRGLREVAFRGEMRGARVRLRALHMIGCRCHGGKLEHGG